MTISIIEALRNAEYNIERNFYDRNVNTIIGINQLHTVLVLLEKGYDPYDDIPEDVLKGKIAAEDVPDKD